MSKRGLTQKRADAHEIVLERAMVTRHYIMTLGPGRLRGLPDRPRDLPGGSH